MTESELLARATDLLKQVPLPLLRQYDNPTAMLAEDIEQFCAGIVREERDPVEVAVEVVQRGDEDPLGSYWAARVYLNQKAKELDEALYFHHLGVEP